MRRVWLVIMVLLVSTWVARTTVTAATSAPGSLRPPTCSTVIGRGPKLSTPRPSIVVTPAYPFGVAVTSDGRLAFVGDETSVSVLSITASGARLLRVAPIGRLAQGLTLSPNGRYLLAGATTGVVVLDVSRIERGQSKAIVGTLERRGRCPRASDVARRPLRLQHARG